MHNYTYCSFMGHIIIHAVSCNQFIVPNVIIQVKSLVKQNGKPKEMKNCNVNLNGKVGLLQQETNHKCAKR